MRSTKVLLFFSVWLAVSTMGFAGGFVVADNSNNSTKETQVTIVTTAGSLRIKLYNGTPKHRDNFLKLVQDHFYDSTLFHRVIPEFMIQGGDPDSKKAGSDVPLGNGGPGYTIPAEIDPVNFYHKKGALAAARTDDRINPAKASSGSQFYIVEGRTFTDADLTTMEERMRNQQKQDLFGVLINKPEYLWLRTKFINYKKLQQTDSLIRLSKQIDSIIAPDLAKIAPFHFNAEQRKVYETIGGTPHLDGGYTVFGEVIEGLDIIDAIAHAKTLPGDRPETDIRILKMTIEK